MNRDGLLAADRQQSILDLVAEKGWVRVSDLTRTFQVSDMTVRRDLVELDRQGLISRVHGGAKARRSDSRHEPGFDAKRGEMEAAKHAIATVAATLVSRGQTIGLSAGTTTATLARYLLEVEDLTVITNSIPVAQVFRESPRPDRTVLLTGGQRTPSDALVGELAVRSLTGLNLDLVFLGVHGIEERVGFTCPNLLEADTNRYLIDAAQHLVVVADHTKWGVIGLVSMAPLSRADTIVMDHGASAEIRAALESAISEVIIADPA
ncbi:DeoR/GlpR family DNA-binding transcription regulator [Propionicimonas sp.]|uniref:DeoR/GlpR family DNA-binding transcription regulator n=1 Tax=Propionicimonas sp. TaxID=1955623 RepID=UPI0039E44688